MYTWDEIQNMTPEELSAARDEMYKKIFLKYIVLPMAIYISLHVITRVLERKAQ